MQTRLSNSAKTTMEVPTGTTTTCKPERQGKIFTETPFPANSTTQSDGSCMKAVDTSNTNSQLYGKTATSLRFFPPGKAIPKTAMGIQFHSHSSLVNTFCDISIQFSFMQC